MYVYNKIVNCLALFLPTTHSPDIPQLNFKLQPVEHKIRKLTIGKTEPITVCIYIYTYIHILYVYIYIAWNSIGDSQGYELFGEIVYKNLQFYIYILFVCMHHNTCQYNV